VEKRELGDPDRSQMNKKGEKPLVVPMTGEMERGSFAGVAISILYSGPYFSFPSPHPHLLLFPASV